MPNGSEPVLKPIIAAQTDRPVRWLRVAGLVAVATIVAYSPSWTGTFQWDDHEYITDNTFVRSFGGLPGIWAIWYDAETHRLRVNLPQYYPLTFTTFWAEHAIWGTEPIGYRAVNILLHLANAALVWRLGRRLGIPAAGFVAAVFALHPMHVASVAWVCERKNTLSGLFYLLALWWYLDFHERGRRWYYVLAALSFAAALLSKSVTVTLPCVILLVLLYRDGRITRRDVLRTAPLLVIGVAVGLFTAYLEAAAGAEAGRDWMHSSLEGLLIVAPRAFCFYALKTLWPYPLHIIYPRWPIDVADWTAYIPLAGMTAALAAAVAGIRRVGRGPLMLLLFSGGTLLPALGVLFVSYFQFSYVADHFNYLGSLGFIILYVSLGVWLGQRTLRGPRAQRGGWAIGVVVLAALGAATFRQSKTYRGPIEFWEAALRGNPDAWIAMLWLGDRYQEVGRQADAVRVLERATQYPRSNRTAYHRLGHIYAGAGDDEHAVEMYRQAVALHPTHAPYRSNLAGALARLGQLDESAEQLEEAVRLDASLAGSWENLAHVRSKQRRWDDAARALQRLLALDPERIDVRGLYAQTLSRAQRFREAIEQYRAVLHVQPNRPTEIAGLVAALTDAAEYADALGTCREALQRFPHDVSLLARLAWLLATCPDDSIRDRDEAVRIAERIQQMVGSAAPPDVLDALAAVAAETGDFTAAVGLAERALQGAWAADDLELAHAVERRLAGYRNWQPHRLTPPAEHTP